MKKPTAVQMRRAMPYALTALIAFALGALLFAPHTPAQLDTAQTGGSAPVKEQVLDDSRTVELDVATAPAQPVRFVGTGTLTSLTCPQDGLLRSGTPVMKVDGSNIVPLATSSPLWRELSAGMNGDDIRALQTELRRLGYSVSADGRLGNATLRATAQLLGLKGSEAAAYSTISPSSFLWISAPAVTVTSCSLAVGTPLETGAEIFTTDVTIKSARVKNAPNDAVPGARKLVVDGTDIALDGDGNVAGEEALAALATSDTYRQWVGDKEGALRVRYVLAEATQAQAISPAAVYGLKGKEGCVQSEGKARKVEIVSSELGKTLVVFSDGKPAPTTVDLNPDVSKTCN